MTCRLETDVVVIGSGPAGSAAVRTLTGQPLSVVWLAGRAGSGCATTAAPVETLDAAAMVLIEAQFGVERRSCDAIAYTWPAGAATVGVRQGFHVDRPLLDGVLRDAARRRSQARVVQGTARTARRSPDGTFALEADDTTRITGRFLIDAAGRRHWLARQLGLTIRRVTPPLLVARSVSPRANGSTPVFSGRPFGWLWQANEAPDRSTWNLLTGARHPLRRTAIAEAAGAGVTAAGSIEYIDATWRLVRPVAAETLALAGEAAMVVDPACGDGIETAIRLGCEAARLAATCLRRPDLAPFAAARYDAAVQRAFQLRTDELTRRYDALGVNLEGPSTVMTGTSLVARASA